MWLLFEIVHLVLATFPIYIGVKHYGKLEVYLKIFVAYLVVGLVTDVVSFVLAKNYINNLWLLSLYNPIGYSLSTLTFYYIIDNKKVRKVLLWSIPIIWLAAVANKAFYQPIDVFDSELLTLISLLTITYSAGVIIWLFQKHTINAIETPTFWIASGLLVFFGVSWMSFALVKFSQWYWAPLLVNSVASIIFLIGMLKIPERLKSPRQAILNR